MAPSWTFLPGVASGIVATLVVVLSRALLGQLVSAIAGLFTRSVKGTWKTRFQKGGETFQEHAEVHQVMHWVWGKIVYPAKRRTYRFRGSLRKNVLVATYEVQAARSTIDRGAFTLALNATGNVRQMKGKYSWTDDDSGTPEADDYDWTKQA